MISYMFVRAADEVLAIPADVTRQVVVFERVSALPGTRGALLGLVPALGRVLPLLNLHALLPYSSTRRAVNTDVLALVLEIDKTLVALPMSEVLGFVNDDVSEPQAVFSDPVEVGGYGGQVARLVSPKRLLSEVAQRLSAV